VTDTVAGERKVRVVQNAKHRIAVLGLGRGGCRIAAGLAHAGHAGRVGCIRSSVVYHRTRVIVGVVLEPPDSSGAVADRVG